MTVTSVSSPLLRLNMRDNVAVARLTLEPVALPELGGVQLSTRITQGHKVAITALQPGQAIIKYGQIIGFATQPIAVGDHVHTHNMAMGDVELAHEFCVDAQEPVLRHSPRPLWAISGRMVRLARAITLPSSRL